VDSVTLHEEIIKKLGRLLRVIYQTLRQDLAIMRSFYGRALQGLVYSADNLGWQ
jgi:hypothetical protein